MNRGHTASVWVNCLQSKAKSRQYIRSSVVCFLISAATHETFYLCKCLTIHSDAVTESASVPKRCDNEMWKICAYIMILFKDTDRYLTKSYWQLRANYFFYNNCRRFIFTNLKSEKWILLGLHQNQKPEISLVPPANWTAELLTASFIKSRLFGSFLFAFCRPFPWKTFAIENANLALTLDWKSCRELKRFSLAHKRVEYFKLNVNINLKHINKGIKYQNMKQIQHHLTVLRSCLLQKQNFKTAINCYKISSTYITAKTLPLHRLEIRTAIVII